MSDKKLFPMLECGSSKEEPWDHRYQPLANIVGCSISEAAEVFTYLEYPEYTTKEHLDITKDHFTKLEKARRPAEKLLAAMYRLDIEHRNSLIDRGAVTIAQLEHLADILGGKADGLKGWYSKHNRTGGRNVAAHIVAEGARRLFRRHRIPITYGEYDSEPTTRFCRAVQETLVGFRIRADWSEPAHKAWQKQNGIQFRLEKYKMHLELEKNIALAYLEVDWSRFAFKRTKNTERDGMIGIFDRKAPDVEPLLLPIGQFYARKEPAPSMLISWVKNRKTARQ